MLTKRERVLTAIQHREPDRVPMGEQWIEPIVQQRLLGESYQEPVDIECEFNNLKGSLEILHADLVCVLPDPSPSPRILDVDSQGNRLYRDAWGFEYWLAPKGGAKQIHKPLFEKPEGVYDYAFPVVDTFSTEKLEKWIRETDYFVFASAIATVGMGYTRLEFDKFMTWHMTNPEEVLYWYEQVCELNIALAWKYIDAGAHAILFDDDIAFKSGTFLSPPMMREMVFPFYARQAHAVKELGVPVFFHSDGRLTEVLDDLVDVVGYEGWMAVEPGVNDIAELKTVYGDRLVLWGNIDVDLLGRGTPEQVEEAVRDLIRIAAPGGGFILSSSNSLGWETSEANARALYDAGEKYGWYG